MLLGALTEDSLCQLGVTRALHRKKILTRINLAPVL
jgi:hypothetical protein